MTALARWADRWCGDVVIACCGVVVAAVVGMLVIGWPIGLVAVLAAVVALFVLGVSMRVERREHEQDCRELIGRPS